MTQSALVPPSQIGASLLRSECCPLLVRRGGPHPRVVLLEVAPEDVVATDWVASVAGRFVRSASKASRSWWSLIPAAAVLLPGRGAGDGRGLARGLQRAPSALGAFHDDAGRFAKASAQAAREGKVIPFTDPAKVLRSIESGSVSRREAKTTPNRPRGLLAPGRAPPCCARPMASLRNAATPLPFTPTTATSSHSRWTDERGLVRETEDTTIADLAVATSAGQIKTGAPGGKHGC